MACDRNCLEQVLFNLLLNAVDNSNKNGKVMVLVSFQKAHMKFGQINGHSVNMN